WSSDVCSSDLGAIEFAVPNFKNTNHGVSADVSFNQRNEFIYGTEENQRLFYRNLETPIVYKNITAGMFYNYSPSVREFMRFGFNYYHHQFADSLARLNALLPGFDKTADEYCISAQLRSDQRDFQPYPLTGSYLDLSIIGRYYDKTTPYVEIRSDLRQYVSLSDRWFAGVGLNGKLSAVKNIPYLMAEALGYRSYVR